MNFKSFLFVFVLISVFCISTTALALTDTEKQALIAQIQAQIVQLTEQLNQMIAEQQVPETGVSISTSWCHTFNINLGFANTGSEEVVALHTALQKENISYNPDDINTYDEPTSAAIVQFQAKYGITPQSGYVGTKTRAKLNQLYGCSSQNINTNASKVITTYTTNNISANTCIPNCVNKTCGFDNGCGGRCQGTCSGNAICTNGQCGSCGDKKCSADIGENLHNCPQDCPPTAVSSNNPTSSGPQVTTETGRIDSSYVVTVPCIVEGGHYNSLPYRLPKTALDVRYYKVNGILYPSNGSVAVPSPKCCQGLQAWGGSNGGTCIRQWCGDGICSMGNYENFESCPQDCVVNCSSNDQCPYNSTCQNGKCSMTCHLENSGPNSDSLPCCPGLTPNKNNFCTSACNPNWQCGSWGACSNGQQTKTCTDLNGCGVTTGKPVENQSCLLSAKDCDMMTLWSACINGQKSRICSSRTVMGEVDKTTTEVQSCASCISSWQCKDWGTCVNGQQTRTCDDVNNCGTDFQSSTETRSCTQPATLPVYWRCGAWSSCENFQQRRLCADLNHPYADKSNDSQYCTICGNGICDPGESSGICPKDCVTKDCVGTNPVCGDGICEGENANSCPQDCNYYCGDGGCNVDYGEYNYYTLQKGRLMPNLTTDRETYWSCPKDCGYCGNGKCDSGKNAGNCPADCSNTFCGNGKCEPGETPENCFNDCGAKWLPAETLKSDWDTCDFECNALKKVCVEDGSPDKCSAFTDFKGNIFTGGAKLIKDSKNYADPSCKQHWPVETYDKKYCCCQERPENTPYSWLSDRVDKKVNPTCTWTDKDMEKAFCEIPNVWDTEKNACVVTKDVSVICNVYCSERPYGRDYYSMFPNLSCSDPWNNLAKCCTCMVRNVCKDIYEKQLGNTVACVKASGNFQQDPKGASCQDFCSKFGLEVKLDKLKMDQIGKQNYDINKPPLYNSCGRYSYYDRCCACGEINSCTYDSDCKNKAGTFCISGKCSSPKCTVATEKTDCVSGQICNGLSGSKALCISCSGEGLSSSNQCCRGLIYLTDKIGKGYCKDTSKASSCGDGICEGGEAHDNCSQDCACTPTCSSSYYIKNCGDDGCGGSCGTCQRGQACLNGFCKCAPVCTGKQCGNDGCGGSCGTCLWGKCNLIGKCVSCLSNSDCAKGLECNSSGSCVLQTQSCQTNIDCPYGKLCLNGNCVMVIIQSNPQNLVASISDAISKIGQEIQKMLNK